MSSGDDLPPVDEITDLVARATAVWRARLADLGGRNTLLWYRELPTGSLDLTVAHPSGEAKLLAGHATRLSELVRAEQSFREALRRALAIRAKIVEVGRERGPALGFCAIGMASWSIPGAPTAPWAPVMVRTCTIEPVDAGYGDAVVSLGPDLVFNPVLAHYLRHEHGLNIDDYAVLAPARLGQGTSFDPRPTYAALERICAGIPGFKLGPQRVISTFPWAKMAMVGDLTSVHLALDEHPVVVALARQSVVGHERPSGHSGPGEGETADDGEAREADLGDAASPPEEAADTTSRTPSAAQPSDDDRDDQATPEPEPVRDPSAETAVLDADARQSAAIEAVRGGASIVLDAPPGTGRTQTLAAMIALTVGGEQEGTALLASQRASSRAAVRRRLAHLGLDHLVLELREDVTGQRQLAADLLAGLDAAENPRLPEPTPEPLAEWTDNLEALRLDHEALHRVRQPWDVSIAEGQTRMAVLAAADEPPTSRVHLDEATLTALDPDSVAVHADALRRAARAGAWPRTGEDPWYGARLMSPEEVERARDVADRLAGGELSAAREAVDAVATQAGLPLPGTLAQWAEQLDLMGRVRDRLDVFRPEVYDAALPQMREATRRRPAGGAAQDRPGLYSRVRLRRQARGLLRPGPRPHDLGAAVTAAASEQEQWVHLAGAGGRPSAPDGLESAAQAFEGLQADLRWLGAVLSHTAYLGDDVETEPLDSLLERLRRLDAHRDRLEVTQEAHALLQPLREAGLGEVVDDVAARRVPEPEVAAQVEFVFWSSLLRHLAESDPAYGGHDGEVLRARIRRFVAADRQHVQSGVDAVTLASSRRAHHAVTAHPEEVWALRELASEPTHVTYADALEVAPHVLPALFPVLSVSPLVLARTVPPQVRAELVVLDDASDVDVAVAVSTIARGRRLVLAGQTDADGRALPQPTGYIGAADERAERLLQLTPPGLTSVLDAGRSLPELAHHRLATHYRGGDQRLVPQAAHRPVRTFPTPGSEPAVEHDLIEGEPAARAAQVARRVIAHARTRQRQSLAVVTADQAGASEVEAAVRAAIRDNADLSSSFREDAVEPFVVRPLARAAGLVRDVLVLVVGDAAADGPLTGPDAADRVRLLASSVRHRLVLVSGRDPGQWAPGPATDALRAALAAGSSPVPTGGTTDPLLLGLARRLRAEGLVVHDGYGVGEDRIDLAVEHPDRPGRPLVAVLSDADPRLPVSRDSVRLRREQLVRLGWWPVTVFSVDLFRDPARDVAMIQRVVREAAASRGRASL